MEKAAERILEARGLSKSFATASRWRRRGGSAVHALRDVSLDLSEGETLGVVGESGCGKSTLGRLLTRLIDASAGTLRFRGEDLLALRGRELRRRRRHFQMIFQDPFGSLSPRMRIGEIVAEGLVIHRIGNAREREERTRRVLDRVGLPRSAYGRHPHELSGGQRQRVGIARAIAVEPQLIVADEPVSALDVSVQAQIVNLLEELQKELSISYVFIAHDLHVVAHISARVAIMYLGRIVEIGERERIYGNPRHPYTKALLAAAPDIEAIGSGACEPLRGEVPSPMNPPSGCAFHPRCPIASEVCRERDPELIGDPHHALACHQASVEDNGDTR